MSEFCQHHGAGCSLTESPITSILKIERWTNKKETRPCWLWWCRSFPKASKYGSKNPPAITVTVNKEVNAAVETEQ